VLFIAGQTRVDKEGKLVSDNLVAQFDRALGIVVRVVEEAGGKPEDILKINRERGGLFVLSLLNDVRGAKRACFSFSHAVKDLFLVFSMTVHPFRPCIRPYFNPGSGHLFKDSIVFVLGDTVNLASRMEGLAEPGATYVTEETFRTTEGLFRFEALGEKQVKGKEEPVKVYRVIAAGTSRTRFDVSAERGLTPFVARERELELLLDGFERARRGRGQAFSIVAEAGVGKSRLLYEFRKAMAEQDVTFLEGKCLSYMRNVAYHPIIDLLKSNFDIRRDDRDPQIRDKVRRGLRILDADEASTLPYLL
jgi:hypothetical protein